MKAITAILAAVCVAVLSLGAPAGAQDKAPSWCKSTATETAYWLGGGVCAFQAKAADNWSAPAETAEPLYDPVEHSDEPEPVAPPPAEEDDTWEWQPEDSNQSKYFHPGTECFNGEYDTDMETALLYADVDTWDPKGVGVAALGYRVTWSWAGGLCVVAA